MSAPLRAEAVQALYAQMGNSVWSTLVVSTYMAGTAAPYTHWPIIVAWISVQACTQSFRILLMRSWRRRPDPGADPAPWARIYTAYMVASGSVWGTTIYLFAHPDQPITVALTMCCLYAIAAGSTPANAYNPRGLFALVGFMFVPVVVRLLSTGRLEYILIGLASGLYALAMASMCRVQARVLDEGFRIRFENRALLDEVTLQKGEAEAARYQAERASLAKSQFLAAASHDLRQPLYALSLFSASLDDLRLGPEARSVVSNIQGSIGTMEQLFEGLLDLSKLDAGVVEARLTPVSVDALFDRLSQYFHPIAMERGLDLRFRSDGEWISSDPVLLEQVIGNLISNALRATVHGGVLVAARARASQTRLEVWDTGIGIAPADLQRIFEEFVQVGNKERDRRKGLGLGLAIARRSSALLGASIHVTSRLGRGSCFALAQQACPAPALVAPPAVARETPKSGSCLPTLVIDDDPSVRAALSGLLTNWGVVFEMAASGAEALALLDAGSTFGLVLADYRLGADMNGLELLATVKSRQADCRPRMALVTADFDPALVALAGAQGVPLLQKPLKPAELRALLTV